MRVNLDLLVVGSCRHPACMVTGQAGLSSTTFPALVGRITHPTRGTILFDTGYGETLSQSQDPVARIYRRVLPYKLNSGEACVHQLAAAGVGAAEVSCIILSHMHPDHAGGLNDFPDANIYLSRKAFDDFPIRSFRNRCRRGFMRDLFPKNLHERVRFIEDSRAIAFGQGWDAFKEGADIFGDGSLVAVPLPGHAFGQIGLKLETERNQEVLLAADGAWLSACYRELLEPLLPARAFIHDYRQYLRTLHGLRELSLMRPDVAIIPSHCSEAIGAFRNGMV